MLCGELSVRKVILPNKIKIIGNAAFSRCENLYELAIPGSIEEIGGCAFSSCPHLVVTVFLPTSLKHIGADAFWNSSYKVINYDEWLKEKNSYSFIDKIVDDIDKACNKLKNSR